MTKPFKTLFRALMGIMLFLIPASSNATHLLGGSLGYEYIGQQPDGTFRYRITALTYTNCGPDSNVPDPDDDLFIGIYENDINNPDADKVLVDQLIISLQDTTAITSNLPANCTIGEDVCIVEATYEGFINLPLNLGGYIVYYQRCCRNDGVINLNSDEQGFAFYTQMPSPTIENSAPVFLGAPTPFLCQNDTTTFVNTAFDPDGDQLIFSFVTAKWGYTSAANPNPGPENPILNWPIAEIGWEAGFDVNQPFGPTGYAFIDGATGLTEYSAPLAGPYTVAIEVREFRNGVLIGTTIRDIQLQVLVCPPNPAPDLSDINGGQTDFQVLAGDSICFPVQLEDLNGDTIVVTSAGAIFDPLIFDPAATITTPQTGAGLVTAEFCWVTSCEQGQELPYQFVASATDDGCPPKTTDFVFQVEVIPFDGPTFIDGNPNPCEDAEYDYETEFFDGANYAWVATGGTVITGQGTNVVTVDWGATGMGMLSVVATNHLGCIADPVDLSINIQNLPAVNAGNDEIICIGDSVQIGGAPTGPVGAVYNWLPADSISDTAVENPIVFPSENTAYIVQVITGFSCLGEDTVDVIVNIPQIDAGDDLSICLGDSVQLNGVNGTSYLWTPSDSLTVDNIADPIAFPADTTVYLVTGPDANTCIGIDSTTVFVLPQPIAFAGPDTVICGLSYDMQASFSVGTDGLWRPQAGINYTDDTSASTLVQVDAEGIYTFTWLEGNANCLDSSEVTIQFIAQPLADAGINDSICGLVFDLQAQSSVGIGTWTLPAGLNIMPSANDPNAVLTADNFGVYSIQWDENNNGCADTSIIEINFIEQPVINAGLNDSICGLEYTFSGSITAGLGTWTANGIAFTDENDPFATATASDNGLAEIIWTANNQNFCFATDTVEIDFQEIPTAEAGDDQSLCADSAILDASTTGAGMWVFPAGVNLSDPSDPNAVLTATPLGSYQLFWNTIIGQCTNSDSVQIELLQSATADAGLDTPICIGDDLTLNGSGGDDYTWTPDSFIDDVNSQNPTVNPDASITYFLEVSLNNGCTDTDSVIVTVNPLPIVDAGEDIDYLCDGDSIQLIATPGFSGYSWSPAGDVSDPLIENPFATGDFTADYVVTVTDANNCMNSDTINIVINGIVPTDAGEDFAICLGDSVQLGATPVGPDGTTYQWTPATGLDDALAENPMAIPTETTTYIVQSTNSICNGADTLIVEIIAVDIPDFEFSLVPGCDGLLVNFFNLGVEDLSYAWDFGDGASSSAYSPSHTYAFNGNFQVGLEVTTAENCVGENSALIDSDSFEEYFQVLVPNVITPNQDGENDILDINVRGNIQECIEFKVFNRWGQVMFNSSGNNTRWDGRTNAGILVSPGVYFYVLELNGQSFKGDIQVIY